LENYKQKDLNTYTITQLHKSFSKMGEDTNIRVRKQVRNKLNRYKEHLDCTNLNEVIEKFLKLISKFKLNKELEAL